MRIAKNNTCTHIDKFIDKKQTALKHLLMNKNASFCLGSHNQNYADKVWCKSGPRRIGYAHYRTVDITFDGIIVLLRDKNIIASLLDFNTKTSEHIGYHSQVTQVCIFDGQFRFGHGGKSYKTTYLNHVGKHCVCCTIKFLNSGNFKHIRPNSLNLGSHAIKHFAKLDKIRLTGGIKNCCFALSQNSSHQDICRSGNGCFIQKHIRAFEFFGFYVVTFFLFVVLEFCSQFFETGKMSIESSSANFIATRLRQKTFAKTGKHRSNKHYATPDT